jgi:hypothetical protein
MSTRELHIGRQSRTLKCTTRACMQFRAWFPGGDGIREALVLKPGTDTTAIALAALLRHADDKIGPGRVAEWIDAELARYPEIEAAVLRVVEDYFAEANVIETRGASGEAPRPATESAPPSSSGTASSSSPGDTGSTPSASGT